MIKSVVSEVQQLLRNNAPLFEEVLAVSAEFSELAAEINSRMTNCTRLLRSGFRDEAIELAEQKPRLLEQLQLVDFPEREMWVDFLFVNGIAAPPELLTQEAEELQAAYEQQRQLVPLMRQHRLLALAHAPIGNRVDVLRKLQKADPLNPLWPDDVEIFERARLAEIQSEMATAKSRGDAVQLKALNDELAQKWSVPIPQELRRATQTATATVAAKAAREQMKALADELNQALAALDILRGRRLRDQWNRLLPDARLGDEDGLTRQTREALSWLADADLQDNEEREFQRACRQLELAIDERIGLAEVERLMYAVQKFDREAPATLWKRANEYRHSLQIAGRRRTWMRIVAAAAAIIVVGAILAWTLLSAARQRQLTDARTQMQNFVTAEEFEAAEAFFSGLPSGFQKDAEIARLWHGLQDERRKEEQRVERFQSLVSRFDLSGPLESNLDQILREAEQIARTDLERSKIAGHKSDLQAERIRRQSQRSEAFLGRLKELADRLRELEQAPLPQTDEQGMQELLERIEALRAEHHGRRDNFELIPGTIMAQCQPLIDRIRARLKSYREYIAARREMESLTTELGDLAGYGAALKRFAEKYPAFPISADFAAVAGEAIHWQRFRDWDGLRHAPFWNNPLAQPADAVAIDQQIDGLLKNSPFGELSNHLTSVRAGLTELTRIAGGTDQLNQTKESLLRKYSRFDFNEPRVYYDSATDVFKYLSETPEGLRIRYYNDLSKQKTSSDLLQTNQMANVGIAGQGAICQSLVKLLNSSALSTDREQYFQDLLTAALADDDLENPIPTDPIVQADIVLDILQMVEQHSIDWKEFAAAELAELRLLNIPALDWMDYRNETIQRDRSKLEGMIPKIRSNFGLAVKSPRASTALQKQLTEWRQHLAFRTVGWMQNLQGTWQVQSPGQQPAAGQIFVFLAEGAGAPPRFLLVGELKDGQIINPQRADLLKSGRPLFVSSEGTSL